MVGSDDDNHNEGGETNEIKHPFATKYVPTPSKSSLKEQIRITNPSMCQNLPKGILPIMESRSCRSLVNDDLVEALEEDKPNDMNDREQTLLKLKACRNTRNWLCPSIKYQIQRQTIACDVWNKLEDQL